MGTINVGVPKITTQYEKGTKWVMMEKIYDLDKSHRNLKVD